MGIEWLVGKHCTGVSNTGGSFTFEFGEGRLVSDSLWRILGGGQIRLTSLDHGQQYGRPSPIDAAEEATQQLAGRRVISASAVEWSADVMIVFDADRALQLLTNSSGYEPWYLRAPGVHLVAVAGGGIADFGG